MKKIMKVMMILGMVMAMQMAIAGCGGQEGPSGTYTVGDKVTYMEFDGDKVTLQMGQLSAVGKWTLKGDTLTLVYDNNAGEKVYTYDAEKDVIIASDGEELKKISE